MNFLKIEDRVISCNQIERIEITKPSFNSYTVSIGLSSGYTVNGISGTRDVCDRYMRDIQKLIGIDIIENIDVDWINIVVPSELTLNRPVELIVKYQNKRKITKLDEIEVIVSDNIVVYEENDSIYLLPIKTSNKEEIKVKYKECIESKGFNVAVDLDIRLQDSVVKAIVGQEINNTLFIRQNVAKTSRPFMSNKNGVVVDNFGKVDCLSEGRFIITQNINNKLFAYVLDVEEAKITEETVEEIQKSLNEMTVSELKALAKKDGIELTSTKKVDIILEIEKYREVDNAK